MLLLDRGKLSHSCDTARRHCVTGVAASDTCFHSPLLAWGGPHSGASHASIRRCHRHVVRGAWDGRSSAHPPSTGEVAVNRHRRPYWRCRCCRPSRPLTPDVSPGASTPTSSISSSPSPSPSSPSSPSSSTSSSSPHSCTAEGERLAVIVIIVVDPTCHCMERWCCSQRHPAGRRSKPWHFPVVDDVEVDV